jgi:DNA-binding response OmpR family regulator
MGVPIARPGSAMKVLIIDRDMMFSSLMASKIRALGHDVLETTIKNDGIDQIDTNRVDAVYFDPSPLTDAKPVVLQVRRMVHTAPYLVLMGEGVAREDGVKAGCHDGIAKPLDPTKLKISLENAERMCALVNRLADESYDFPSAGGVISKSAFNQLFISALDRTARYGESAHVLFLRIANYEDIKLDDGKYAADYAFSRLAQIIARARRQSDILGQIGHSEYALLLQRPVSATESMDAAKRFAVSLESQSDIASNGVTDVRLEISLIYLPTGEEQFHHEVRINNQIIRNAG